MFKAIDKGLPEVSLASLKLRRVPNLTNLAHELISLTSLNLSKNNLFDGDEVFAVSSDIFLWTTELFQIFIRRHTFVCRL